MLSRQEHAIAYTPQQARKWTLIHLRGPDNEQDTAPDALFRFQDAPLVSIWCSIRGSLGFGREGYTFLFSKQDDGLYSLDVASRTTDTELFELVDHLILYSATFDVGEGIELVAPHGGSDPHWLPTRLFLSITGISTLSFHFGQSQIPILQESIFVHDSLSSSPLRWEPTGNNTTRLGTLLDPQQVEYAPRSCCVRPPIHPRRFPSISLLGTVPRESSLGQHPFSQRK